MRVINLGSADDDLEIVCECGNGALATGSEAHTSARTTGRSKSLLAYIMSVARGEYRRQAVLSPYLTDLPVLAVMSDVRLRRAT